MLNQEAITEFKQIYLEEYGDILTNKEALEKANRFFVLMKAIYKPISVVEGLGVPDTKATLNKSM